MVGGGGGGGGGVVVGVGQGGSGGGCGRGGAGGGGILVELSVKPEQLHLPAREDRTAIGLPLSKFMRKLTPPFSWSQ